VNTTVEPATIAAPAANYAHAVLSTEPGRILHSAGVVPVLPDGTVPVGISEQADAVWQNIAAILAEAAMALADIVSMTTYAVAGEDLAAVMAARDTALGGHRAASTLVLVPALARPEWKVEVAVVAVS
jgi:enamine deaminase RidA (YjgF/YER057c/UK114 family)